MQVICRKEKDFLHYNGKFYYYSQPNVVWFDFTLFDTQNRELFNDVDTILLTDFKPKWVRVFTTGGGFGHYNSRVIAEPTFSDGKYVSDLGELYADPNSGLVGHKCVVEVGMPDFTGEIRREFGLAVKRNQSWWDKFIEWMNTTFFGTFLSLFKLLGTLPDIGQITDIYELKLVENPTGDISSSRSSTVDERISSLWEYLKAIKDVYGGVSS